MKDQFQRTIDYARISITDRCNLYCTYCRPDHEEMLSHGEILRYEEILRVCKILQRLELTNLRSQVANRWYEKVVQILSVN